MGIYFPQDNKTQKIIIKNFLRLLKGISEGLNLKSKFSKDDVIRQEFINCICAIGTTWMIKI